MRQNTVPGQRKMLKMGSLLLEAEITGKELLGQLKAGVGVGVGAKYKKAV